MPGTARQPILSATAIWHVLHCAPVIAPFRFRELLDRPNFAHRDFCLIELRVEPRHVRKRQNPGLNDGMQGTEIQAAAGSAREPRVLEKIAPPHCSQPRRERPAADNARRYREVLPLRTSEKRTTGAAADAWLPPRIAV